MCRGGHHSLEPLASSPAPLPRCHSRAHLPGWECGGTGPAQPGVHLREGEASCLPGALGHCDRTGPPSPPLGPLSSSRDSSGQERPWGVFFSLVGWLGFCFFFEGGPFSTRDPAPGCCLISRIPARLGPELDENTAWLGDPTGWTWAKPPFISLLCPWGLVCWGARTGLPRHLSCSVLSRAAFGVMHSKVGFAQLRAPLHTHKPRNTDGRWQQLSAHLECASILPTMGRGAGVS